MASASAALPDVYNSTPCSRLELLIKAERLKRKDLLSKSDPLCIVYQLCGRLTGNGKNPSGQNEWREVGRTERIRNTQEPEWSQRIALDYFFEERQTMKFEIWDWDTESLNTSLSEHDFLGSLVCELAEIVSAGSFCRGMGENGRDGTIVIVAEEIDEGSHDVLQMRMSAEKLERKDFFGLSKSDPYLKLYRFDDYGGRVLVHRTEYIRKCSNPNWQMFELSVRTLCNGDRKRSLYVECWDHDDAALSNHDFIGSCEVTVEELIQNATVSKPVVNEKKAKKSKSYKNSGTMVFRCQILFLPTFVDFISGGTQLDFSVAIDFTASNGNPLRRDSLHFITESKPNQYEIAIKAILEICQHYSNSKLFNAYGFGAKMSERDKMIPIFPLMKPNASLDDASVAGVEGVMFAYKNCLHNVRLHGPTNFAPIVEHVATSKKNKTDGSRYHILLIITDGAICDMERTKKAIIAATGQPISIIIVGVGNDLFDKMDELDGDEHRLQFGGRMADRDIVQFVPLRQFMSSSSEYISDVVMAKLAKEVLAEVPNQLTSYMRKFNLQPRPVSSPWPRDREIMTTLNAYLTGPAGVPPQPPLQLPQAQPANGMPPAVAAPPPVGFYAAAQQNPAPYSEQAPAPYPQQQPVPYPSYSQGPVQGGANGFPYGALSGPQQVYSYPTYPQPNQNGQVQHQVQQNASAPPVSIDDLQLEFVNVNVSGSHSNGYPPNNRP